MNVVCVMPPGLCVDAVLGDDSGTVIGLGVAVRMHPSIPEGSRTVALEAVLRHWQRQVGMVHRTRHVVPVADGFWLPGWTLQKFQDGAVIGMRVAYRYDEEEEKTA